MVLDYNGQIFYNMTHFFVVLSIAICVAFAYAEDYPKVFVEVILWNSNETEF